MTDKINKENSYSHGFIEKANRWYGIIAIIIYFFLFLVYPGKNRIINLFFIILKFFNITITKDSLPIVVTIGHGIMIIIVYFIIKIAINAVISAMNWSKMKKNH